MEDPEAFRAAVRAHAATMLNGEASPYEPAWEIWVSLVARGRAMTVTKRAIHSSSSGAR
ncbi:hypothetical protein [Streptomyces sp. NPDC002516]